MAHQAVVNDFKFYTLNEAKSRLKIGKTLLFKLLKENELNSFKIGRRTFIFESEILNYLKNNINNN